MQEAACNSIQEQDVRTGCSRDSERRGRVLVVDDTPDVQRLLRALLTHCGVEVDVAENGQQACVLAQDSAAAERAYDLILMDIQMPVLDGLAATQQLRKQEWNGPIVAITGFASPEGRQRCLEAGCNEYLAKPLSLRDLQQLLARYVRPGA